MRHYSVTAHMRNSIAKPTFQQWKTQSFFAHKFQQLIENYDVECGIMIVDIFFVEKKGETTISITYKYTMVAADSAYE